MFTLFADNQMTPIVFHGGENNNSNLCRFNNVLLTDDEDIAEDDVHFEGIAVDFPRTWRNFDEEVSPVLIRVPRGVQFRRGLPSYELSQNAATQWGLMSPEFIFPGITTAFPGTFDAIASAGGLVLIPSDQENLQATSCTSLDSSSWRKSTLIVSNPRERSYRMLPPMIDMYKEMTCNSFYTEPTMPPPQVMGIFTDASTGVYHVPILHRSPLESDVVAMQVYDSDTEAWRIFGQWRMWEPEWKEILEMTYVEGTFFFLVHDHGQGRHEILFLEDDEWQAIGLLPDGYTLSSPTIFELAGSLMLGGFLPKEQVMNESDLLCMIGESTEELSFGYVWHHDFTDMKWNHFCNVPFYWSHNLYRRSPGSPPCTLKIVAGGNYVCFASSNGKIAQFDVSYEEWTWLPDLEMNSDEKILIVDGKTDSLGSYAF